MSDIIHMTIGPVGEYQKRLDKEWRNATCGECGWGNIFPSDKGMECRRVAFGRCYVSNTGEECLLGELHVGAPACPAFVPREEE